MNLSTLQKRKNSLVFKEVASISVCVFGFIFYAIGEPRFMSILAFSLLVTFLVLTIVKFLIHKLMNLKVNFKIAHYTTIAFAITICFAVIEAPSQAILFDALEQSMTDILTATGDTVDEAIITGLFSFFRFVVILAFVGGAIAAVVQALQGSDWRPIANMMGIGVGLVLSIEVLSNLILGAA